MLTLPRIGLDKSQLENCQNIEVYVNKYACMTVLLKLLPFFKVF